MNSKTSLPLGTSEYNLSENRVCRCNQVKIQAYWIRADPNPKTSVLVRKETQRVRLSADRGGAWAHASAMEEPGGLQSMELKKSQTHLSD